MKKIWRINGFIFILVLVVYAVNWYTNHRDPESSLSLQRLLQFNINALFENKTAVESSSINSIENPQALSVEDQARLDEINQAVTEAIQDLHIANSLANERPDDVGRNENAEKAQTKLDELLSEQENILNAYSTNRAFPL